jgi:flagellar export protein FliJ
MRLDTVVRVKEREEERRLDTLSQAQRRAEEEAAALREAQARAEVELTGGGMAADFCVYEAARARALEVVRRARLAVEAAQREVEAARAQWVTAKAQTEAVRRVADARHAEVRRLAEAKEQKALDDLTLLRFARAS